ncbi:MAG: DegV family EDD domain-containing protein [Peptoniphilus sp. oral taxon 375]|nr:DegV family EDD domain-containing protein [Peptoniphilus sp. oral taxon 375]
MGYGKILAIAISQSLSGTYNSMRLALESQDMDYRLIDSKTITMGQGLLLTYGHQLIQEGLILDEIAEKLEEKKRDVKIFAGVGDLKYLVRGGRLSRVKGLIGGSLRLNPILALAEDGSIENYKSVMGKKRTLNFIVDKVRMDLAGKEPYYLALAYAGDRDKLGEVKDELGDLVDGADQYLEGPVTAVLGTHSGPDAYVVAYLRL